MLLARLLQTNVKAAPGDALTADEVEGQFRAAMAQIGGSAVLILNTGVNRNLALWALSAQSFAAADGLKAKDGQAGAPSNMTGEPNVSGKVHTDIGGAGLLRANDAQDPGGRRNLPRGPVSFSDNMVTFDAISEALTLSLCSVAILSLDDVGMHDNHCAIDLWGDYVLIDALVLGVSVRVQGNRFREILPVPQAQGRLAIWPTFFSAVTLGLLNATEMNQGTYCFLALGPKKPQVLMTGPADARVPLLDTNRHMIADALCGRWTLMSRG
jgi:hypothetical protein